MNVVKKIVLLLSAILFVCVATCFGAACSKPEANWATYHNPKYGYTIDYPQDWDLDTSGAPEDVRIYSSTAGAIVGIVVFEGWLPIDTRITVFQDTYLTGKENLKVISSRSLEGKWQWVIEFTHTFEGVHCKGEAYFGETLDCQYYVILDGHIGSASVCKEVAETFVAH